MARPFSMSRLWHHVSIPAEVDGFVIPSPTWLPHFVHVFILSLSSFSLSLFSLSPSLSLFSFFSPPQRWSLSRWRAGSLSLPLFLSSLSSLPLSNGLSLSLSFFLLFLHSPSATVSLTMESTVSLSPSLSLFSFFSPPQRRRARSLSLPLFISSLSSLPLIDGLSCDGEQGLSRGG